ncbi:MAG: DUF721 domain-containing protein [Gammaproteobacteria bacterium]|nr:DUF721 domain-containing protein [Gammaproteobacteria bacterium]
MKKMPVHFPAVIKTSRDGTLSPILRHAHELLRVEAIIRGLLPQNLRSRFRVANLRGRRLVLSTDSPVWATRLRCQLPDVLRRMKDAAPENSVSEIDVKVALSQTQPTPKLPPHPHLSARSAKLLRDAADGCDDGALQAALLRLASHE